MRVVTFLCKAVVYTMMISIILPTMLIAIAGSWVWDRAMED